MKIIYATDQYWPRISGMAPSIDAFKGEFEKMGHSVYIFAPEYPGSKEIDAVMNNHKVFRFKSYGIFFSPEDKIPWSSERTKVYNILDYIKPDIIHVHTEFTMGRLAWEYATENNIPLVMTAHTNWEELINLYMPFFPEKLARIYSKYRLQKTYNRANAVIVPTFLMQDLLLNYNVSSPTEVIPTGIVLNDFEGVNRKNEKKNSEWYNIYPALKGKKVLLSAGRIGKEKNLLFLVNVLEILVKDFPDIVLVFAGDGPYRSALEKAVEKKGLTNNVVFTGFIVRAFMKNFYAIADIFLFSSKVESQGLVTIESMACRTPVVAIGEMGTLEVMNGDNGGFMVKDNLQEFTDKVKLLLTDRNLYDKKSKEAFEYSKKWTIEKNALKMLKIYKRLKKQ